MSAVVPGIEEMNLSYTNLVFLVHKFVPLVYKNWPTSWPFCPQPLYFQHVYNRADLYTENLLPRGSNPHLYTPFPS